jgi:hypothetical protein
MFQGTGIGGNSASRNGATAQGPEKSFIPIGSFFLIGFGIRQGFGDTAIGIIDDVIDRRPVFGFQAVFFIPDIQRCRLQRQGIGMGGLQAGLNGFQTGLTHKRLISQMFIYRHFRTTPHYILGFIVLKTQDIVFMRCTLNRLVRPVNQK